MISIAVLTIFISNTLADFIFGLLFLALIWYFIYISHFIVGFYILSVYAVVFLGQALKKGLDFEVKFIFLVFILIYSFAFLINLLSRDKSIWFKLFWYIMIMAMILTYTGITFGSTYYYYSHKYMDIDDEEEKLVIFEKEHLKDLEDNNNEKDIIPIIFLGLKPFFTFPETTNLDIHNKFTLIPFIEHVIGWFTSTTIIGILASHFVVKNRKEDVL
ncbi:hypothetical protein [Mechercharimyces sp. CAU 1602]|uniref:hypothetical protein n=1 Tax=Mechercharimyces sp. CAU 1602 TaxID=2973933 RepID=UPI002161680B|nr:hypothetical protein [Mechercharimyces sp. CAU 1602]